MSDEVKKPGSGLRFWGETISELKKVVWLSRQEVAYLTFLVLLVAVLASLVLGGLDFGFSRLIDTLFVR